MSMNMVKVNINQNVLLGCERSRLLIGKFCLTESRKKENID